MSLASRLTVFTVVAAGAWSCASRDFNGEGAETNVVGGADVTSNAYPGVLNLVDIKCTGAKVGPRHILTARHCVPGFSAGSKFTAQSGYNSSTAAVLNLEIVKVSRHPDQDSAKNIDLAVIEVKATAGFTAIPTAALSATAVRDRDAVKVIGFGCTARASFGGGGGFASGATSQQLKALACSARTGGVNGLNASTNIACDFSHIAKSAVSADSVPGLCPGDSGGPLFTATNPAQIVGVNSNYHPSGISKFARVDAGASGLHTWVKDALR